MKAENLRNPKMVLHIPIAPSKLELLASKRNRAFFLGHPVFQAIDSSENMKYLVHASYLEIYNEEIRDLLGDDIKKKLDLKEHPERGVYVKVGLTSFSHQELVCTLSVRRTSPCIQWPTLRSVRR